jgi:dihydroxyacetone kinase
MVSKLGKAKPGDKTFIDTLAPFAHALAEGVQEGTSLDAAWQSALAAAEAGAASTAQMSASRGRSAKHGDRSLGHRDPGAVSMLYLLQSVGKVMAHE